MFSARLSPIGPEAQFAEIATGNRTRLSAPANHLSAINGLRGVAILLVFYYHAVAGTFSPEQMGPFSPLLTNGWSGVNLFFILSGLVLFLPHASADRPLHNPRERLAFYRRRLWRLMPLFYVAVLAEWALAQGPGAHDLKELAWVLSGAFTFNSQEFGPSFNVPLWSIGVEITFSLMFPMLVLGLRRFGIAHFAALILSLALIVRVVGVLRLPTLQGPSFNSDNVLCRVDEFVLGMILAQLFVAKHLPSRPGRCAGAGLVLVALAWIGFDMVLHGALPPVVRAVLNNVLDVGLCAIVIAALVPCSRLATTLAWAPLQTIGIMCYSLYIWHLPLLRWLVPDRAAMSGRTLTLAISCFLTMIFCVGALSYRLIEFPNGKGIFGLFKASSS